MNERTTRQNEKTIKDEANAFNRSHSDFWVEFVDVDLYVCECECE